MELKQDQLEVELDQITEELQASIKAFGEANIKLSNAHNREFALKIENEKLGARVSELYKQIAELKLENEKLNSVHIENRHLKG